MSLKRAQLVAFTNAFQGESGLAPYEEEPWLQYSVDDLLEKEKVLTPLDCDLFDLFRPVRDPRLVATELSETRTTLSSSGLMDDLACPICMGICKEVMVVKDCSHRFCGDCIQKWLRSGNQVCPQCRMRIPSRRALRHDDIFDAIIERLFPDVEKFERDRAEILESVNKRYKMSGSGGPGSGPVGEPDALPQEPPRRRATANRAQRLIAQESAKITSSSEGRGEDESRPNLSSSNASPESDSESAGSELSVPPPRPRRGSGGQSYMNDEAMDYTPTSLSHFEVFLVCLNHNLPPAACSMARELSKRPLKFPLHTTTRDVASFLAERLIRDVLGSYDIHAIINDLQFVREGDAWPGSSTLPLAQVCRAVTESRGPVALRYVLSDRLFNACERAGMY